MKVRLDFELPGDKESYDCAFFGEDYKQIVVEITNYLARWTKHTDLSEHDYRLVDQISSDIHTIIADQGVPRSID